MGKLMPDRDESWDDYADGWDNNKAAVEYSMKAYETLLRTVDLNGCKHRKCRRV